MAGDEGDEGEGGEGEGVKGLGVLGGFEVFLKLLVIKSLTFLLIFFNISS